MNGGIKSFVTWRTLRIDAVIKRRRKTEKCGSVIVGLGRFLFRVGMGHGSARKRRRKDTAGF
jgi:hypothetical protein